MTESQALLMRRFLVVLVCICILFFNFVSPVSAYYMGMPASVVIGQPDFTSSSSNQGSSIPAANTLSSTIVGIDTDGTRLYISDASNNRVLIYNHLPTTNNASADIVLGQVDMTHNTANQGGIASASTLNAPRGLFVNNGKLFVVDLSNNRVLIWNTLPTSNDQPADVVVGQPDFSTTSPSATASNFHGAFNLFVYQGKLLVAESTNRRILIFNSIPTTNGASADVVVGHSNMNTGAFEGLDASHFATLSNSGPRDVIVYQGRMLAMDFSNSRVLIWNSIPTTNGTAADVVVGQPDFVTNTATGNSCSTFLSSGGLTVTHSGRILIDDQRVLIFNSIPTTNGATGDLVIGQPDCSTRTFSPVSATSISNAVRFAIEINNKLYVADSDNARVLIYPNTIITPSINLTSSPSAFDGSGRYKLTGNIFMNNNGNTYGLQTLQADLNGVGYGNVVFPGGRSDTGGNSTYDFNYDFDPTVGLGSINNLTIKFLASTFNVDTNTLFYFLPFNFKSFNLSNIKLQNFTFSVNKNQLQRVKDNLDHFEIYYKKNTTTGTWTKYIENISKTQLDKDGVVSYNKINGIKFIGSYIFKVTAVDNWGNKEDSNYLYIAGTAPITLLASHPTFEMSFVAVPSGIPTAAPIQLPTSTPYIIPTEIPSTRESGQAGSSEQNKMYLILAGLGIGVIFLIGLLIVRKRFGHKE